MYIEYTFGTVIEQIRQLLADNPTISAYEARKKVTATNRCRLPQAPIRQNGARECARRLRQVAKGMLSFK